MRNQNMLFGMLFALTAAAAATAPGCVGCQGKAPLAYAPEDALIVVVVPSVKGAIESAAKLLDRFKDDAPVKLAWEQQKAQIIKEIGFDPESPESLDTKGIAAAQGIVVSVGADGDSTTVVLGVSDRNSMEKYLREMTTKVMGGGAIFKEQRVRGQTATVVTVQGSDEARLAWVHVKKAIVICPKAKDGKLAEYAAQIAGQQRSIKANKTFERLRDRMGMHQAFLYVDGAAVKRRAKERTDEQLKVASEWMRKSIEQQKETADSLFAYFDGAALALELSKRGVSLRGYLATPKAQGKRIVEILHGIGEAPDFGEFIGPTAIAIGKLSLNPKKLWDTIRELAPASARREAYQKLDRVESETKVSFEKDLLPLLAGRFAFAMFPPQLDKLAESGFRVGQAADIAQAARFVAMAQVTDAKKAQTMLSTLERIMTQGGADVSTRSEGERKVYFVGPSATLTVAWTVVKEIVLVGSGENVTQAAALIEKGGDNVLKTIESSRARKLVSSEEGFVVFYDTAKTADMIRGLKLPAEAKLMLSSGTSTLGKFQNVTYSLEPEDDGVMGELTVELK